MILAMQQGCVNASQGGDFCMLYKPVYTTPKDTELTKQQVDNNNVVWIELCNY